MSSYERSKGTSRLPSWRSNEPPAGQPEDLRVRGPVIRPSDFIQPVRPTPSPEPRQQVEREIFSHPPVPEAVEPRREPPASMPREEKIVERPQPIVPVASAPILDLRSAVRAIWSRKLLILVLAIVFGGLGAAVIPMLPQKFTAETSLYFDPNQIGSSSDSSQATVAPELISALIDSQTQILSSGKVLGRVVDALKLDQDPQFNAGTSGDTAKYVAIAVLQKAAVIARAASTYVVSLKVTTRNPQQSAQIANQIVTSFMDEESKAAATAYHSTNSALDSRLNDLRQQLQDAENAAEAYRADNDMVAVQGGGLISDKRLTALNDLLVTAQQKTIEAKARADAVGKLSFEDVVASNSAQTLNSTSNSLTNLRQQYAVQAASVGSLESQLGTRHPRLLAARSSLESIAAEIRSELQRLSTSAQSDYQQAQKAEQDIAKELAVQKATQVNTSSKLVGLNELERKAAAARDIYEALVKRSDQANEDQSLTQTSIRVISEAVPPLKPDGPSKKIMMVAGLITGALLGMGLGMAIAVIASLFRHPLVRSYLAK
jgi:uncharacterized protein involved in exopolysaccharide biosynthesis